MPVSVITMFFFLPIIERLQLLPFFPSCKFCYLQLILVILCLQLLFFHIPYQYFAQALCWPKPIGFLICSFVAGDVKETALLDKAWLEVLGEVGTTTQVMHQTGVFFYQAAGHSSEKAMVCISDPSPQVREPSFAHISAVVIRSVQRRLWPIFAVFILSHYPDHNCFSCGLILLMWSVSVYTLAIRF